MAFRAITRKYQPISCLLIGIRRSCFSRISTAHYGYPIYTEEFEIGSRLITLETMKQAWYENPAVELQTDDISVSCTACRADVICKTCYGEDSETDTEFIGHNCLYKGAQDFLLFTVDYEESFADREIPLTHERQFLCESLIYRSIRPLFPVGFYDVVEVTATVLRFGTQEPDVMAANATSTALMLSDIPWDGPIGMIRVGRINGRLVVNPSMDELNQSDLNLVYACTRDKTLMVDVQAHEISERDLEAAFRFAHLGAVKFIEPQLRLAAKTGEQKEKYELSLVSERTMDKIYNLAEAPIKAVFTDPANGKFKREETLAKIGRDVKSVLEEEGDEESLEVLSNAVDIVRNQVLRRRIITEGFRLDGRRLDEIRPIYCETGDLSGVFGSALFSCGETQVLCDVTIGTFDDTQQLDSIVGPSTIQFMLHYNFSPYCVNEVGKRIGLNCHEVRHGEVDFPSTVLVDSEVMDSDGSTSMASACGGEVDFPSTVLVDSEIMASEVMVSDGSTSMASACGGAFAEKALRIVYPAEHDFPYIVHVNSEVMSSDGSTLMATVCGGSMALMEAGIPLRKHVAGLSVGLVTEVDPSTGVVDEYRIITDISGLEYHIGDMDFKIAGTRTGVTAIQLDIKSAGIPLDIICESLGPAYKGRLQILDHMEREINAPRTPAGRNSPLYAVTSSQAAPQQPSSSSFVLIRRY